MFKNSDLALLRCKAIFRIFELGLIAMQTDFFTILFYLYLRRWTRPCGIFLRSSGRFRRRFEALVFSWTQWAHQTKRHASIWIFRKLFFCWKYREQLPLSSSSVFLHKNFDEHFCVCHHLNVFMSISKRWYPLNRDRGLDSPINPKH